ncbi:GCN5-related N-acetyltransferase [Streptomyces albus]|nr:GCN5-related N-acetyltransferase [Streptomyces albus]
MTASGTGEGGTGSGAGQGMTASGADRLSSEVSDTGRLPPDASGVDRLPQDSELLLDARELHADPARSAGFAPAAHALLAELVAAGAPLGWPDPPAPDEVEELLAGVCAAAGSGDAALRAVYADGSLLGLGYWRRYARPTHRPHADLEKVAAAAHGRGLGRLLTTALVEDARGAGIEVLTLDARGDNHRALALYASLGFREYGRLPGFVAVGEQRWDKVFCMVDLRGRG